MNPQTTTNSIYGPQMPGSSSPRISKITFAGVSSPVTPVGKSIASPVRQSNFSTTSAGLWDDGSGSGEIPTQQADLRNYVDVFGVRISPAVIKFINTLDNQTYEEAVSVQNVSKNSVNVRMYNPRAWSFRLTSLEQSGHMLAPGLKIKRRLHYTCTKSGILQSTLPIYVNDQCFELPLEAFRGQAYVEFIPTSIQFGRVDVGSKPKERKLVIKNVSFCATKFLIDLGRNELELQVTPLKGWIRPHSQVTIKLQLFALNVGEFSSELWITTDLSQSRIHVQVDVCKRNLIVLHPNSISDFTLVDFPKTFYGCKRYQTVIIYNMAASSSTFVILADFGDQMQEPFAEAKQSNLRNIKMFDVEPIQGRIRPFEGRIFTFWFQPKAPEQPKTGWKSKMKVEDIDDFLCPVRVQRIQVNDVGSDIADKCDEEVNMLVNTPLSPVKQTSVQNIENLLASSSAKDTTVVPMTNDISVLFCLYGESESASLFFVPDTLYFNDVSVSRRQDRVVHFTNKATQALAFRYIKIPYFDVSPSFKKLAPKSTCDVAVTFSARRPGTTKKALVFEVLAYEDSTDEKNLIVVNHINVKISCNVKFETKVPQPKFNPGITPLITHEVGFLGDEVKFSSEVEKPRGAMVAVSKERYPWLDSDATIAFPNDMPLTLRPRPTDATAKTIYTGKARYIAPVDESLTYTEEQLERKKNNNNKFFEFLRGTAAVSLTKGACCKWKPPPNEPMPTLAFDEKKSSMPQGVLVPLTFVQLYRINVFPALISFGSVTTSKHCSQSLNIENNNSFQISAKLIPITTGVSIQILENFIVEGQSVTRVKLTFHRETLGRYSGTITCIINGFHTFDIGVVAEVVPKSLSVLPDRVEYRPPEAPFEQIFIPLAIKNPLDTPINFSWLVPVESPLKIEPILGVTPKKGTVWCAVYFEPETPNYKLYIPELYVEDVMCHKLKTGIALPKPNAYFLEKTFNIGYIPMKLYTIKRFMIFNPDFCDSMFVVLNKEPIKGIKVSPSSGVIKARSCKTLSLHISMTAEGPINCVLYVNLQNSVTIDMKIVGDLVYPKVEITPKYINLHRNPCNSSTKTTLIAENKSKAKVELYFDMKEYPQFKVSLSKRHHDNELMKGFILEPAISQKFYLHFIPKDLASYEFQLPVILNNYIGVRGSSSKETDAQAKAIKSSYRNSLISNESERLYSGGLNQKLITQLSHLVLVDVVVAKALLVFSNTELLFTFSGESKSFTIKNAGDEVLCFLFRSEESSHAFTLETDRGDQEIERHSSLTVSLCPGDIISFTATFTSTFPGTYINDFLVVVTHPDHTTNHSSVRLKGTIKPPYTVTSSVKDVYLAPVPLNLDVNYTFYLNVEAVDSKENIVVDYSISDTKSNKLFSLEFPRGNSVLAGSKASIPVRLSFKSISPVSVKRMISFYVKESWECSVNAYATADKSIITTHAFFKFHSPFHDNLKKTVDSSDKEELIAFSSDNKSQRQQRTLLKNTTVLDQGNTSSGSSPSYASYSSFKTITSDAIRNPSMSNVKMSVQKQNSVNQERLSDNDLSLHMDEKEDKNEFKTDSNIIEELTVDAAESSFPYFPLDKGATDYSIHMTNTCLAVQQWVYEQVFNCSYYPVFGSHAFATFFESKKEYGQSAPVAMRNLFDVLERICGRSIRRYFTPLDKMPAAPSSKVLFIYNKYRQVIEFLVAQGALLSHVEPQHLMNYDDYCYYFKTSTSILSDSNKETESEALSSENFRSLSIQCWLDLFLQIFKTLILNPAIGITPAKKPDDVSKRVTTLASREQFSKKCMYGRAEEVLLTWLTQHYNQQRSLMWPSNSPPQRMVNNFDFDLEDGLVLTAVTAAYCPFLTDLHFQNMFLQPLTVSQAYHNAVCLTTAWGIIKLGFSISPRDFIGLDTVKMVMLVTHLYKILPTYKPETTIEFMTILNSSSTHNVYLENVEDTTITYNVEILPNNTCFEIDDNSTSIILKRKQRGKIVVRYTARNTSKNSAILLLCGACMPPKFGRNYVYILEGTPIKLPISQQFNIISPLNIPKQTHITIDTPHLVENSAIYEIWITETEPQPGNLNAYCWVKERTRKVPRRLFVLSENLLIQTEKRKRSGQLLLQVCCFSQAVHSYWLLFKNQEIGDFIVKLQISPGKSYPSETFKAVVDPKTTCSCGSNKSFSCSRTVFFNVPCRNLDQWSAVRTMFELTISPTEKEFWATYIESNIGFRLLQWMLEKKKEKLSQEIETIFRKSKTYTITCKSEHVRCATSVNIPNVRARSSVPIPVHINEDSPNHKAILTLTSSDGQEIRSYYLKIICDY